MLAARSFSSSTQIAPTSPTRYLQLNSSSLLQTLQWARFKAQFGWSYHLFEIAGSPPLPLLVLSRSLFRGKLRIAYAPQAPPQALPTRNAAQSSQQLHQLSRAIAPHLPSDTVLMRWDTLYDHTLAPCPLRQLHPAPVNIQPPDTTIVELGPSDQELLKAMHAKTRYNLRLAERKGVTIRMATVAELPQWYALYQETAARDKIAIHSLEYYRALFETMQSSAERHPQLFMLLAEAEGECLSGIIVAIWGNMATYLYGASSNRRRNWMAGYLLQWRGMQLARERGCRYYDLYGIPPRHDPRHAMSGLYRFKVGFGGAIVHRAGAWDWYYRPLSAHLLRLGERGHNWYHKKIRAMLAFGG